MDTRDTRSPVSGRDARGSAARTGASPATSKTWLVLQGDVIDEVQSVEPPKLDVRPGERRKLLLGGSSDPDTVQRLRDHWYPLARGVTGRGEAY